MRECISQRATHFTLPLLAARARSDGATWHLFVYNNVMGLGLLSAYIMLSGSQPSLTARRAMRSLPRGGGSGYGSEYGYEASMGMKRVWV